MIVEINWEHFYFKIFMASCVFIVVNIVYRKQTRCLIIITPNMSPAPVPAEAVAISMLFATHELLYVVYGTGGDKMTAHISPHLPVIHHDNDGTMTMTSTWCSDPLSLIPGEMTRLHPQLR